MCVFLVVFLMFLSPLPGTPTQTKSFLIAERRDERKAVRTQEIRDIKGLKQRVSVHGHICIIRHSINEWRTTLIIFLIISARFASVSGQSTPHRDSLISPLVYFYFY